MQETPYIISQSFNLIYNLLWLNHSYSTYLANKSDRGIITNLNGEELHKVRPGKWKINILDHGKLKDSVSNYTEKNINLTSLSGLLVLVGLSPGQIVVIWFS